MRSGSKKKKSTSSDIVPSKTSSEFGASPDFRTPIARDKTADVLNKKSGHFSSVGESVLEDTLEGCENQEEYPEVYYVYSLNLYLVFFFLFFIPVIFSFLMHGSYLCLVPNQQQDSRNMLKTELIFFHKAGSICDTCNFRKES